MPVRSLSSSVLKWPDDRAVDQAVRQWVREILPRKPEVVRIGYFGSYARGDWGVGSDLDLLVVVDQAEDPFERRPLRWDTTQLPVPAEVLIYNAEEWDSSPVRSGFRETVSKEAIWVYERGP